MDKSIYEISDDIDNWSKQFLEEARMSKVPQILDNFEKWAWRLYYLLWASIIVLIILMIVLPDQ